MSQVNELRYSAIKFFIIIGVIAILSVVILLIDTDIQINKAVAKQIAFCEEVKEKVDNGYKVYLDGVLTNPELIDIEDYKITGIDDDIQIVKLTCKQT